LQAIEKTLREGRAGTAMKSFQHLLSEKEIANVALFVRENFIVNKQKNTKYHTRENGWFDHEKYRDAFPFALGEIGLDTPWEALNQQQKNGKRLFMNACVSCHDRAKSVDDGQPWLSRPLSFPRNSYSHKLDATDALSAASPMAVHDRHLDSNDIALTAVEKQGEKLFVDNCVFCHGVDGKGKNWIGSFIEPHPRDLSDKVFLHQNKIESLVEKISNGVSGSAMPAWKTVLSKDEIESIARYLTKRFIAK